MCKTSVAVQAVATLTFLSFKPIVPPFALGLASLLLHLKPFSLIATLAKNVFSRFLSPPKAFLWSPSSLWVLNRRSMESKYFYTRAISEEVYDILYTCACQGPVCCSTCPRVGQQPKIQTETPDPVQALWKKKQSVFDTRVQFFAKSVRNEEQSEERSTSFGRVFFTEIRLKKCVAFIWIMLVSVLYEWRKVWFSDFFVFRQMCYSFLSL